MAITNKLNTSALCTGHTHVYTCEVADSDIDIVIQCRLFVIQCCLFVIQCRLFVTQCRLFVIQCHLLFMCACLCRQSL